MSTIIVSKEDVEAMKAAFLLERNADALGAVYAAKQATGSAVSELTKNGRRHVTLRGITTTECLPNMYTKNYNVFPLAPVGTGEVYVETQTHSQNAHVPRSGNILSMKRADVIPAVTESVVIRGGSTKVSWGIFVDEYEGLEVISGGFDTEDDAIESAQQLANSGSCHYRLLIIHPMATDANGEDATSTVSLKVVEKQKTVTEFTKVRGLKAADVTHYAVILP